MLSGHTAMGETHIDELKGSLPGHVSTEWVKLTADDAARLSSRQEEISLVLRR